MIELSEVREQRRARLIEWRCDGVTERGICNKFFVELDPDRPCFLKRTCERCGKVNVWVEAYRSGS